MYYLALLVYHHAKPPGLLAQWGGKAIVAGLLVAVFSFVCAVAGLFKRPPVQTPATINVEVKKGRKKSGEIVKLASKKERRAYWAEYAKRKDGDREGK